MARCRRDDASAGARFPGARRCSFRDGTYRTTGAAVESPSAAVNAAPAAGYTQAQDYLETRLHTRGLA